MRRRPASHDSTGRDSGTTVRDALFAGALTLWQPKRGYRVNVDTLILAAFAARSRPKARRVVDLGAGVGALGLSYAFLADVKRLELVERERALADLARRNLGDTRADGAVHVADFTVDGLPGELRGEADVVLVNPPFFEESASQRRKLSAERGARTGSLEPFLRATSAALGRRAAAFFAYPAPALGEFFAQARAQSLVPKRLQLVHAYATSPSRLALFELRRAKPGGLAVDPPLVEWLDKGVRSAELESLLAGKK
jgi:tRNA1(Val) A37 N6-methylase TrmN6